MSEKLKCESCSFSYRADKNERCPYCGWNPKADPDLTKGMKGTMPKHESDWSQFAPPVARKNSSQSSSAQADSVGFAQLIEAQNRTTFAVRSMAIFFFITLCSTLVGYFFLTWAAAVALKCTSSYCGDGFLSFLGWLVILVGFIWGVISGVSELGKSRVRG